MARHRNMKQNSYPGDLFEWLRQSAFRLWPRSSSWLDASFRRVHGAQALSLSEPSAEAHNRYPRYLPRQAFHSRPLQLLPQASKTLEAYFAWIHHNKPHTAHPSRLYSVLPCFKVPWICSPWISLYRGYVPTYARPPSTASDPKPPDPLQKLLNTYGARTACPVVSPEYDHNDGQAKAA